MFSSTSSTPTADVDVRHGLLLFDGDCGMCTALVRTWTPRLPGLNASPWQRVDVERFGITPTQCARELQWVSPGGTVHGGAMGVARLLQTFDGIWRTLGVLLALPLVRNAAALVYRIVAKNRHRFPSGTQACQLR